MAHIRIILILLGVIILVSCTAPADELLSEEDMAQAIAGTLTSMPPQPTPTEDKAAETKAAEETKSAGFQATMDAIPNRTPKPSATPTKRPTPSPTPDIEIIREEVLESMVKALEAMKEVDAVTLARFVDGVIEIEVRTFYFTKDSQPDISYQIIRGLSTVFGDQKPETLYKLVGADSFLIQILSYSADGDYPYESFTDLETIQKVFDRTMSYDEWVAASNAGFK